MTSEQKIPLHARQLLTASILISMFGVIYQLYIWYKARFQEISWVVIVATLASASINMYYQYHVFKITDNVLGMAAAMVTVCMCIAVIAFKGAEQWSRKKKK